MPRVADSAIEVATNALYLIGADAITDFTANTVEANVANALYEDIVRTSFASFRWRFATTQSNLTRLTTAPKSKFDAAYHVPTSCITAISVTINDVAIKYDIYGNRIFCDATTTDTVVLDYVQRESESNWPSYFTTAIEFSLAASFAISIARDAQLAGLMEDKAAQLFMKARNIDSQQQTTRKLVTSRFIAERRS